jgi:hypothetical protein
LSTFLCRHFEPQPGRGCRGKYVFRFKKLI